jgi:hypothetical protein
MTMANIDQTILTSDNPERLDAIMKEAVFNRERGREHQGPGKWLIETAWGVPHEEITKLSKNNPAMTFKAVYSFEHNLYSEIDILEYKDGEYTFNKEPGYLYSLKGNGNIFDKPFFIPLREKAESIFRRIDVVRQNDEGKPFIDWYTEDITLDVVFNDYKMTATKRGPHVEDISVFKMRKVEEITWDEVKLSPSDMLPF